MNAAPSQSVSPNDTEWSGQGNEVNCPSVHVSPPQNPSAPNQADQPSYRDWMSIPFFDIFNEDLFFGQMGFQPENSANYDRHWVPMRFPPMAYQPPPPPLHPSRKSLIKMSTNGYRRARLLQSKDAYWLDVGKKQMKDAETFDPTPGSRTMRWFCFQKCEVFHLMLASQRIAGISICGCCKRDGKKKCQQILETESSRGSSK